MEQFKEGYWWIYYDTKTVSDYFIGYYNNKQDVPKNAELIEYLGNDYTEFLGRFKIKAS